MHDQAHNLLVSIERPLDYSRHVLQEIVVRVSKVFQGTPGVVKGEGAGGGVL